MSNTKSSGGQSSKGFLHWLKNTWLGKLWNYIVSCFRPKKQKTEPQSASGKQEKAANDNNNDESKSSDLSITDEDLNLPREDILRCPNKKRPKCRKKVQPTRTISSSLSSQSGEEIFDKKLIQKRYSNSSQTSIDSISSNASQISSNASLSNTSLPELSISRDRSQSSPVVLDIGKNENQTNTEQPGLEWDNEFDIKSPKKDETLELSSQLKREPSSSNIENSDDEATKREQSKSKAQHTSCKTKNRSKQNEQSTKVLKKKEGINRENEKKGEQTLKKSEEKLSGAAKRKQTEDKKKSEKARGMRNRSISNDRSAHNGSSLNSISNSPLISQGEQKPKNIQKSNIGNFAFVHDDGPNQSLSNSNSSLASQSGIDK